jgi:S1-C subfamily serine protease
VLVQGRHRGRPRRRAGVRGGDPSTSASIDGLPGGIGGDVIQSIDGKAVDSMDDVAKIVDARKRVTRSP